MIKISEKLKNAKAYNVTKQVIWDRYDSTQIWKLDWNEEFIVHPKVIDVIKGFIDNNLISYYPDTDARLLKKKLSLLHNVPTENILIYSGSDDALDDICRTYLDIGDCVVYNHPEYSNFDVFVISNGAILRPYFDLNIFNKNLDGFYDFIRKSNPKIVYLSNPNNPTGYFYEKEFLISLFKTFPNTLFIVDEAYIHFSSKRNNENYLIELISIFDNLIITRTFSKLYSLAGLRIGYILSNKNHINNLRIIHKSKNITMIAQYASIEAIEQKNFFFSSATEIIHSRESFSKELIKLDFVENVFKSEANFVCVKLKTSVSKFLTFLELNKIYVRDRSKIKLMDNIFRITIIPNMDYPLEIFKLFERLESSL
jgi:histidinol-phosphate aminotransferase